MANKSISNLLKYGIRPRPNIVLSENGTWGGSTIAVKASSVYGAGYEAWRAFSADTAQYWESQTTNYFSTNENYFLYDPKMFINPVITIKPYGDGVHYTPFNIDVYTSNDDTDYTLYQNFSRPESDCGSNWLLNISGGYKFIKLNIKNRSGNQYEPVILIHTTVSGLTM